MYGMFFATTDTGHEHEHQAQHQPLRPTLASRRGSVSHNHDVEDGLMAAHGWTHAPLAAPFPINSSDTDSDQTHHFPRRSDLMMGAHGWTTDTRKATN